MSYASRLHSRGRLLALPTKYGTRMKGTDNANGVKLITVVKSCVGPAPDLQMRKGEIIKLFFV
jgi:hypothetical protein